MRVRSRCILGPRDFTHWTFADTSRKPQSNAQCSMMNDPHILARAVVFMYCGSYPMPSTDTISKQAFDKLNASIGSQEEEFEELTCHAHCYALGDKYDIPTLKSYARDRFRDGLLKDCTIDVLLQSIKTLYTTALTSDDGVRKLAVYEVQKMWPFVKQPRFPKLTEDRA